MFRKFNNSKLKYDNKLPQYLIELINTENKLKSEYVRDKEKREVNKNAYYEAKE